MRVRYSFSSRHTGRLKNIKKQREKFPNLLRKVIEFSDIILEILDARFIDETRNLVIEEAIKERDKIIIYIFNKIDLIDKEKISKEKLHNLLPYAFISCQEHRGGKYLRNKIKAEAKKINKEKVIVGVIGYQNTGKSSVINLLIGKSSAKTGKEAGFTKGIQKLKLTENIILLDSPGVIPTAKYSSKEIGAIAEHAKVGARTYDRVKDAEMIVARLFSVYTKAFQDFYKLKKDNVEELIEQLGRQKNILKKGNEVDADKTSRVILKDWQEGKISPF